MATDYIETKDSKDYWIDDKGHWWGYRTFEGSYASLDENRTAIRLLSWTVNGIALLPKRVRTTSKDPDCPGMVTYRSEYHFPDNPRRYTVGAAKMAIHGWGVETRLTHDANGDPMETEPGTDGLFWRVVQGSNIDLSAMSRVVISTAYPHSSIDWDGDILAGIGKKNLGALTKAGFLSPAAGEIMQISANIPEALVWDENNSNVPIRFEFAYHKGGWPAVMAQQYWRGTIKEYVMHSSDDPNGDRHYMANDGSDNGTTPEKYRIVVKDRPIGNPVARTLKNTHDFSALWALLTLS